MNTNKITHEEYDRWYELNERIGELIYDEFAKKRSDPKSGIDRDAGIDNWFVESDRIEVHWSASWRYGGHDEGREYFSLSDILEVEAPIPACPSCSGTMHTFKHWDGFRTNEEYECLNCGGQFYKRDLSEIEIPF